MSVKGLSREGSMKKTHLIAIIMGGAVLGCAPAIAEDCDFNPGAQLKKLEVKPSATCTLTDAKVIGGAVVDSGGVLILNHSTIDGGLRADGGKLGIYATTDGPSVIHGGLTGYNLDALQIMGAVIDGQASVSGKASLRDFICSSTIGGGLTVSWFKNLVVGNPPDCKGNT